MRAVCLAMLVLLLQGCGLKGPLYLPTEDQKRATAERERLLREREARRAQQGPDLLPDTAPPPASEPAQMEPAAPPPQ
jgi:predicted small lipoprotein YifL